MDEPVVLPVVTEELVVEKQRLVSGAVTVQKHVDRRLESLSVPLIRETVEVRREAVNREVEEIPEIRTEGDTTIIPVVEEVLVVSRRWMLKEEIFLTTKRETVVHTEQVELLTEHAEITRHTPS